MDVETPIVQGRSPNNSFESLCLLDSKEALKLGWDRFDIYNSHNMVFSLLFTMLQDESKVFMLGKIQIQTNRIDKNDTERYVWTYTGMYLFPSGFLSMGPLHLLSMPTS